MAEIRKNRGISRDTRTAAAPKFKPRMDKNNGLNLVTATVELTEKQVNDDTKQLAFIGLSRPSIVFTFTQADADGGEPAKYIHSFRPIDYTDDTLELEDKDAIEDSNIEMLYHLMLPMVGRDLTDEEFETLTLDFGTTKDTAGNEVAIDPTTLSGEVILEAYRKFYNAVITIINKNKKLAKQRFWLKLLLYIKTKAVRGGSPAIPRYVGDGFLERASQDKKPTLSIAIAKGESIVPREMSTGNNTVITGGNIAAAPQTTQNAMPDWGDDE